MQRQATRRLSPVILRRPFHWTNSAECKQDNDVKCSRIAWPPKASAEEPTLSSTKPEEPVVSASPETKPEEALLSSAFTPEEPKQSSAIKPKDPLFSSTTSSVEGPVSSATIPEEPVQSSTSTPEPQIRERAPEQPVTYHVIVTPLDRHLPPSHFVYCPIYLSPIWGPPGNSNAIRSSGDQAQASYSPPFPQSYQQQTNVARFALPFRRVKYSNDVIPAAYKKNLDRQDDFAGKTDEDRIKCSDSQGEASSAQNIPLQCAIYGRPPVTFPPATREAYLAHCMPPCMPPYRPLKCNDPCKQIPHEIIHAVCQQCINQCTCFPQNYRREEMPGKLKTLSPTYEIFSIPAAMNQSSDSNIQCQHCGKTMWIKQTPPCDSSDNPRPFCKSTAYRPKTCKDYNRKIGKSPFGKGPFVLLGLLIGVTAMGLYNKYACAICKYLYRIEPKPKKP